jgi:hypothetical protein
MYHGDLSPANIVFRCNPTDPAICRRPQIIDQPLIELIDLGGAVRQGESATVISPDHAAPELDQGVAALVTIGSEVFSACSIIFPLFTDSATEQPIRPIQAALSAGLMRDPLKRQTITWMVHTFRVALEALTC